MTYAEIATAPSLAEDNEPRQHRSGSSRGPKAAELPLCVDLDGTLTYSDTLLESIAGSLQNWQRLPRMLLWLAGGRACLKQRAAEAVKIAPALLPYNQALLAYLKEQKARGRRLVLATAADRSVAQAVAAFLGVFDEVIASDGKRNLRGDAKASALVERFGERRFAYVGSGDRADIAVWRKAGAAVVVDGSAGLEQVAARLAGAVTSIRSPRPLPLNSLVQALRPHQWVKNILVFVPILTAAAWDDTMAWASASLMFLAFCLAASAIYVLNDICDLDADRQHPRKRNRPFASGAISIAAGFALMPALLIAGCLCALASGGLLIVAAYAVSSILYSMKLKELPLLDVFTLAGLYTIRLFGGGEVTGHAVSLWLLGFSCFIFFSLATMKRVAELSTEVQRRIKDLVPRRGYRSDDLQILQSMGTAASFVSALVLALYVQSETASSQYSRPEVLWATIPLLLLWQCRLWLSTSRGNMHDDPIVYAAKDRLSWLLGAALLGSMAFAKLL